MFTHTLSLQLPLVTHMEFPSWFYDLLKIIVNDFTLFDSADACGFCFCMCLCFLFYVAVSSW